MYSIVALAATAAAVFIISFVIGLPASVNYLIMQDKAWTENPDLIGYVNAGKLHYIFFWVQLAVSLIITYLLVRYIKKKLKAYKELMLVCLASGTVIMIITGFILKGLNYLSVLPVLLTAIIMLISLLVDDRVKKIIHIIAAYLYTAITGFLILPLVEAAYRGLRLTYNLWITPALAILLALALLPGLILIDNRDNL
jgi:hypothetical protein